MRIPKKLKGYSTCGHPYYHTREETEVSRTNLEKIVRTAFYPRQNHVKNIYWGVFEKAIRSCKHKIYYSKQFGVCVFCYDKILFVQHFYSMLVEAFLDATRRIMSAENSLYLLFDSPCNEDEMNNLIRLCIPTEKALYDSISPIKNLKNKQLFFDYSVFLNSLITSKSQWDTKSENK